ncbi:MAG: single-stranded-DNA-specific exonuclease RecJ [Fusobacteriaceae bacterium]|jgi:single-stranded-DNA-specific exonuclease|nr:single-stranded-DNA-specific exonuclease RecJ [Fusobacteriaceae bacterium]
MRNTKWIVDPSAEAAESLLPPEIDPDIAKILFRRGIRDPEGVRKFLEGTTADAADPFLLRDVERAVERILAAISKREEIWIYGDYDVDGITSTSLLYSVLNELGASVRYYIPMREEGYGLNCQAMEEIKNEGCSLVITVDCGISSVREVALANSLGMDVILTDHHEITGELPAAFAVINPKRPENLSSFRELSGVATIFTVARALYIRLGKPEGAWDYLDMVAVGTIADVAPLTEENRLFTKIGLQNLSKSKSRGFKLLLSRLYPDWEERTYSPYDVGFVIGPLFNAAGRLEDAKKAVELFVSRDRDQLTAIIEYLLEKNKERKRIQEEIFQSVLKTVALEQSDKRKIIIAGDEGFHSGVIGIVASKILEKYYRPVIIYEIRREENIAVASCRSIESFNIIEALRSHGEFLEKYGGHAMAAGFTVSLSKLEAFKEKLYAYAERLLTDEDLREPVRIERFLPFYKINYDFLRKLSALEPFGAGNPSPIFATSECLPENTRRIGKDQNHLMTDLWNGDLCIKNCVWFQSGAMVEELRKNSGKKTDVAFKLRLETWKSRINPKMYLEDIKLSDGNSVNRPEREEKDFKDVRFPLEAVVYTRKEPLTDNYSLEFREDCVAVLQNKNYVDKLEPSLSCILGGLHRRHNRKFRVECIGIAKMADNYNVRIRIDREYAFESYALKESVLFQDIKRFLIGEAPYSPLQKEIFRRVFFDGLNTMARVRPGQGIRTVVKTVGFYYGQRGKRALLITGEKPTPDVCAALKSLPDFEPGYDFYLLIDPPPLLLEKVKEQREKRFLILISAEKTPELENFHRIEMEY